MMGGVAADPAVPQRPYCNWPMDCIAHRRLKPFLVLNIQSELESASPKIHVAG